ncbi:teichoic acid D-Ala incorporation-associated protein DltX [Streptococcus caviae]|nr:teichoic acid D-Ala incorporation-associated protein DltX [Streptococcus sp. 'caviae']OLN83772.1 D-alanyl-lipoteichoic acid biosynthesis protein [Streptococcus sp. 'caviae']
MKPFVQFVLRTFVYALIFLILIYFFSYLGHGKGNFIYNEF